MASVDFAGNTSNVLTLISNIPDLSLQEAVLPLGGLYMAMIWKVTVGQELGKDCAKAEKNINAQILRSLTLSLD